MLLGPNSGRLTFLFSLYDPLLSVSSVQDLLFQSCSWFLLLCIYVAAKLVPIAYSSSTWSIDADVNMSLRVLVTR